MSHKELMERFRYFFKNDKTSWGKVELLQKMEAIYTEFLEDLIDAQTK